MYKRQGYQHVLTPSVASTKLYKISGHLAHYKDDMFPIMSRDDDEFVLRPMNCPEHMIIYKSQLHSYRDLPIRIAEIANDFRFEASGALTGIEQMCIRDRLVALRLWILQTKKIHK